MTVAANPLGVYLHVNIPSKLKIYYLPLFITSHFDNAEPINIQDMPYLNEDK